MTVMAIRRLHWGCGASPAPGWINSGRSNLPGVDVVCDVRDGLPLESDSIDYAVSVHALQEVLYPDLISVRERMVE